jgi:Na+-driven multidrug efflux pump
MLCAKYIGKNQAQIVLKITRLTIKILFVFALLTLFMMVGGFRLIGHLFCVDGVADTFFPHLRRVLFWTWVALSADAFRWMLHNILISADDVRFTVGTNIACFWLLAFPPIYLFIYIFNWGGAAFCWQCFTLDSSIRIVFLALRFRSARWWRKVAEVAHFSQRKPPSLRVYPSL